MSSDCAHTRRSFNAVTPATNNLFSTPRLPISRNAYYPCSPSWFSPRTDIASVSTVLLPTDSSEAITAVLLDTSRALVKRVDALWDARKQAKYIEAVSSNASVDPAVLRILQRKYKPFAPRPIKEPSVFYGVRLCLLYTSDAADE